MSQIIVQRKDNYGKVITLSNDVTEYKFDDVAVYECEKGYALLDPGIKHYCTSRRKWTNPKKSKCVST